MVSLSHSLFPPDFRIRVYRVPQVYGHRSFLFYQLLFLRQLLNYLRHNVNLEILLELHFLNLCKLPNYFLKKLEKKLVSDVLKEKNMLLEKLESLCVLGESLWVATDNDGAGWTQMLRIKPAF